MTTKTTAVPGLDISALQRWLAAHEPGLLTGATLGATVIAGGRSNITYAVTGGAEPLVLRRPPLGHVQSTAHDMAREFRVISALQDTAVPVPRTVLFIDDAEAGVDAPFYLMQHAPGRALQSRADNAAYSSAQLHQLSHDLAKSLAALHAIDPASVGLEDFGRADGFLTRQVARWGKQYAGSQSRPLPQLDALQRELAERIPVTTHTSIVHGDFRLDNALVEPNADGTPVITAILDWEMATLGDSLTDLGLFGLYWNIGNFAGVPAGVVPTSVHPDDGYPPFEQLVEVYADAAGIEIPELSWYLAFAAFKLAVILEGIHFRFQAGQTVGEGFEVIGSLVDPIARAGRHYLAGPGAQ